MERRYPANITEERFWANQERLAANQARADAVGAARPGPSLLGVLLHCGRCGRRLLVCDSGPANALRYSWQRAAIDYGEPLCQSLAGQGLDELLSAQVLTALQPAALELSLAAAADVQQERERLHQHWQQQLERARYDAESSQPSDPQITAQIAMRTMSIRSCRRVRSIRGSARPAKGV